MKPILFPLLLCLFSSAATAQDRPTLLLKLRPTALLDYQTPVAHIGIELRTASRFSFEVGYGMPLYGFRLSKKPMVKTSKLNLPRRK